MRGLFPNSIQQQLQLFFALALSLAVLAMGVTWISYDKEQHERSVERVLGAKADLIGALVRPALIFSDKRLARELLVSSQNDPEISLVRLFLPDGRVFMNYPYEMDSVEIPFQKQGEIFLDSKLRLYRTVLHKGSTVGVICIESPLGHMNESMQAGIFRVVLVMFGSLALGLLIAVRMQKKITGPIAELADLMRRLGSDQNYNLRANGLSGNRELAGLAAGFNQMAEKIQKSFLTIEEQHIHLKESEGRFRNIVELAPIPIVISRPEDGTVLFYNRAALQMSGLKSMPKETPRTVDFYDDPDEYRRLMERIAEEGEIRVSEMKGRRADGRAIWVSLSMCLMEFEEEKALFTAYSDITDRKDVEMTLERMNQELEQRVTERTHELQRAKEQLQTTLDNLLDTYYRINADGTISWTSKSIESLLGYQAHEIEGMPLHQLFADKREFLKVVKAHSDPEVPVVNYEVQLRHRDGRVVWGSISSHLLCDAEGREIGSEGVLRNITELKLSDLEKKEMEKKLADVQRLESLGILAGGIAHDFNNLLAAIMGNAELAELKQRGNESINRELDGIVSCSSRAADLCNQLLAYSGQGMIVRQQIDLSELIEEIVQLIDVSISKSVSLKLDLNRALPSIHVDETQMQQIIMNLVTNASESIGDQSGQVAISTGVIDATLHDLESEFLDAELTEGRHVYLEVSDTGCGMDEVTRKRIFDPFFTTKFTGRGLGLSALLGIVRSHHGSIRVDSQLGRGTRVRILFPQYDDYTEIGGQMPQEADFPDKDVAVVSKVLVIDDEPDVLSTARAILEKLGCTVMTAKDGVEGISIYRQVHEEIDLVLLDMTMPKMNGMEALAELRKITPNVPVVICSGYGYANLSEKFKGLPPEGFLHKPYSIKEIRNLIGRLHGVAEVH